MGYGIDEKEKFLLERKLEELTQWSTDTSGRIGAYNPAASDTLDTRLLDRRKKAKTTTKPDPKKLKVKPVVEPTIEPKNLNLDLDPPALVPTIPKLGSKVKPSKPAPKLVTKVKGELPAPKIQKPKPKVPRLLQPIDEPKKVPRIAVKKPGIKLPIKKNQLKLPAVKKPVLPAAQLKLPSQSRLKLPQAQLKIPAQVSQANNRISSIRRNLDQIARNPQDRLANQKYIAQIEDKLKKVKSPSIKARLKSELNRLTAPATPAKGPAAGKPKPEVKVSKPKAKVKPTPKPSAISKGVVQPIKGEGIKAFAKRLGFNSVEEFEKANPKGVGIDKSTGNKFVKTGVNYVDKLRSGVENELKVAKAKLQQATQKGNTKLANKLKQQIDAIEGKPKPEVIKPADTKAQLKDLRSKWNLKRNIDLAKMQKDLLVKGAGKLGKQVAGYGIPILNVALTGYNIYELMLGSAGGDDSNVMVQGNYRMDDLQRMDSIIDSDASIEEKRQMLNDFGSNQGVFQDVVGSNKWKDDHHAWENDSINPAMPLINDDRKKIDIWNFSANDITTKVGQIAATGPYIQKDIDVLIRRLQQKRDYDRQRAKSRPASPQDYNRVYEEKMRALIDIQKSLPKTRVDGYKKVFAMAIDTQEETLARGETFKFTNKNIDDAVKTAENKNKKRREDDKAEKENEPSIGDRIASLFKTDKPVASMGVKQEVNQEVATEIPPVEDMKLDATGYNNLMSDLSKESGVDIRFLKALGMQESGIHIGNDGKVSSWDYTGDENLGTEGSFGIFHVRSSQQGAAVEQYNKDNGTNYNWKDIANNPRLSATIGAWYFSYWLKKDKGNPYMAYMHYNGGPKGHRNAQARRNAKKFLQRLKKFRTESLNFTKKSAILEGMSKVNI